MWALDGRTGGNTLAVVGGGGTGKSWMLEKMKKALESPAGGQYFSLAPGEGTYGLEPLGFSVPEKLAFILDELNLHRIAGWLTNGKRGFWKHWLSVQSDAQIALQLPKNKQFDRVVFDMNETRFKPFQFKNHTVFTCRQFKLAKRNRSHRRRGRKRSANVTAQDCEGE